MCKLRTVSNRMLMSCGHKHLAFVIETQITSKGYSVGCGCVAMVAWHATHLADIMSALFLLMDGKVLYQCT